MSTVVPCKMVFETTNKQERKLQIQIKLRVLDNLLHTLIWMMCSYTRQCEALEVCARPSEPH